MTSKAMTIKHPACQPRNQGWREGDLGGKMKTKLQQFTVALVTLKSDAGKLELWKTLHAIDEAAKVAGWEIAEQAEKKKGK